MVGTQMALRILGAGHQLTASVRRGEHAEVVRAGGIIVDDPVVAATGCDVLGICVFDAAQVRDLLLGGSAVLEAVPSESVVVIHTTADPQLLADVAAASPTGVHILDSPFSGSAGEACKGALTIMAGGEPAAFERARPVLSCYANNIHRVGELGAGQTLKLLNNMLYAANLRLAAGALQVSHELGLDPTAAVNALLTCSAGSWAMRRLAQAASIPELLATVERYLQKDLAAARAVAALAGVDLGLMDIVTRNAGRE
jgi:3-hydroxyisobutyrate dehydrogenase-like beta-hydroxyacid dehydrogenase